jgi:hydrogenase/urease accessory protein HupE
MMRAILAILLAALALALCDLPNALAHEVRPARLEIIEQPAHHFTITWKQPVSGDRAVHLKPILSNRWLDAPPVDQFATAGFLITTWVVDRLDPAPLAGQQIHVDGLTATITDVLVTVMLADGRRADGILTPSRPAMNLELERSRNLAVPAYLMLGIEHILTGADHLMFVFGLILLVGLRPSLIKAVTAFTVAHSITLCLSALDLIHVPSALVEALVALSIVFVAAELLRSPGQTPSLARTYPWAIAFIFGLLHGLAFAGALAEIGLPSHDIPLALLLFNLGVELGQLAFIALMVPLLLALHALAADRPILLRRVSITGPSYVIGVCAAFWFIERLGAAFAF